ncbi:hypothetical protein M0802_016288 [Mischocyttarus mexicanus]|nr:hypothetical protein M0802_016288 [Mischocyttarus mexicanus]
MTSEQKRVRPDTPLFLEDLASIEEKFNEKEMILNKKMEEIAQWQERLFRMHNKATKQQEELEAQRKEVELKERKIEELRKSYGLDFSSFRGFQRAPTPVDQFVTLSQTEQKRVRPDTPLSLEDLASIEERFNEKEMILNKKMEEIAQWQERLFRMQNEATKQQEELEAQRKDVEIKERRIEELRKSYGLDFSGFRGFQRAPTPVDQFVTLSQTPNISRPSSPQPSPRPHLNSTRIDVNTDLRAENQYLRRELESLRRATQNTPPLPVPRTLHASIKLREIAEIVPKFDESLRRTTQNTPPLPVPRTLHASIKLREIAEIVPKFDGNNISISQFARACRRALDSLPFDFTDETETSLTRLLISKLSGHAYLVVEGFKITKLPNIKKPGEHVLDYFSRIREITHNIIDEESKTVGRLERRVEQKIEEEGLDADKQLKEDEMRNISPTYRNRVANIKQIKEVEKCNYSHKPGHNENECYSKITCNYCHRKGHPEVRCYKKLGFNTNNSKQNTSSRPASPTKQKNKRIKTCSFCKRTGHVIFECRTLKYKTDQYNQGNGEGGVTGVSRRSPTPKQRPRSPSPKPGPSRLNT